LVSSGPAPCWAPAGRERILEAYGLAVTRGFRFFSYGDAMLIL